MIQNTTKKTPFTEIEFKIFLGVPKPYLWWGRETPPTPTTLCGVQPYDHNSQCVEDICIMWQKEDMWNRVTHYQLNSSNSTKSYYLKLDVSTSLRGLHQKKLVLSSSDSWRVSRTGRTENQLLLMKASDRGWNVKFQVIIFGCVWWI